MSGTKAPRSMKEKMAAQVLEAAGLHRNGRPDEAVDMLIDVVRMRDTTPVAAESISHAYLLLAMIFLDQKDSGTAKTYIIEAVHLTCRVNSRDTEQTSEMFSLLFNIVKQTDGLGTVVALLQDCIRTLEDGGDRFFTKRIQAYATLGDVYRAQDNPAAAEAIYRKAFDHLLKNQNLMTTLFSRQKFDQWKHDLYHRLFVIHAVQGHLIAVEDILRRMEDLYMTSGYIAVEEYWETCCNLGYHAKWNQDWDGAERYYVRSLILARWQMDDGAYMIHESRRRLCDLYEQKSMN